MKKLENPQKEIYYYIVRHIQEEGYPPTVREICNAVGLKSTATVHTHLEKLESKGLIQRNSAKQRSLCVISDYDENRNASAAFIMVPIVGNVAAGAPILAIENVEETVPIPSRFLHGARQGEAFILRVEGSSMVDIGIQNGDYIVVHNGLSYANGDIVVARIQDERATVKRIYKEKTRIRLQPENSSMQPIYAAYSDVEVVGKVIGLYRGL